MSTDKAPRVAVLWRGDRRSRATATPETSRFRLIFEELGKRGIEAEPAVYDEKTHEEVRAQLRAVDGVLVWVNPIQDGRDRSQLDQLLREVACDGPWISAHPDVTAKMGVKDVLFRTRHMSWGTDTQLYESSEAFRSLFPDRLGTQGSRVLKRSRGNDGQGVWKVQRLSSPSEARVEVTEAHGVFAPRSMPLTEFLASFEEGYFGNGGTMVDQPFQPRLRDGMSRCYVSGDRVAGFAHQYPSGLIDPAHMHPDAPRGKLMFGPEEARFARLKALMERQWIPELKGSLDLATTDMPVIWDADFLYGPRDEEGADTYVLCEINVSSVFAIPDEAAARLADNVALRCGVAR
jgi:hypothetical protein